MAAAGFSASAFCCGASGACSIKRGHFKQFGRNVDTGSNLATDFGKALSCGADEFLQHILVLLANLFTAGRKLVDVIDDLLLFDIGLLEDTTTFVFGVLAGSAQHRPWLWKQFHQRCAEQQ